MKLIRVTAAVIVILSFTGCAEHHDNKNTSNSSSSAKESSTAPSKSQLQKTKTSSFNKEAPNPYLIPVSSKLLKPIPANGYDLALLELYMIDKAGLINKVSDDGMIIFFEPNKYKLAQTNVFDKKSIVNDALLKEKSLLANVHTNQPFSVLTEYKFNPDYNFKKQYFPMNAALNKNSSFSFGFNNPNGPHERLEASISDEMNGYNKTLWPEGSYRVRFTNYKCIKNNLYMQTSKAKTFLNMRTNAYSNIDNRVYAKINFVITGYKYFTRQEKDPLSDAAVDPHPVNLITGQMSGRRGGLYAKILDVSLYNSERDASIGSRPIATYSCQ